MSTKKINNTLIQKSRSKGEVRTFEIYNEKFIRVHNHTLFADKTYHLNLSMLEPWPVHHRRISWKWLLGLVYFSLATCIYSLYLYQHQESLSQLAAFIYIFVLLSLGSLVMFIYHSPDVTEFRSRYAGCVLISLLQNSPGKNEFKAFIGELKTRILAASQAVTFDKKQMLAIEIQELRRLADDGALSDHDYEKAKAKMQDMNL